MNNSSDFFNYDEFDISIEESGLFDDFEDSFNSANESYFADTIAYQKDVSDYEIRLAKLSNTPNSALESFEYAAVLESRVSAAASHTNSNLAKDALVALEAWGKKKNKPTEKKKAEANKFATGALHKSWNFCINSMYKLADAINALMMKISRAINGKIIKTYLKGAGRVLKKYDVTKNVFEKGIGLFTRSKNKQDQKIAKKIKTLMEKKVLGPSPTRPDTAIFKMLDARLKKSTKAAEKYILQASKSKEKVQTPELSAIKKEGGLEAKANKFITARKEAKEKNLLTLDRVVRSIGVKKVLTAYESQANDLKETIKNLDTLARSVGSTVRSLKSMTSQIKAAGNSSRYVNAVKAQIISHFAKLRAVIDGIRNAESAYFTAFNRSAFRLYLAVASIARIAKRLEKKGDIKSSTGKKNNKKASNEDGIEDILLGMDSFDSSFEL